MFLLHIVHTSAARTEPSACLNRLQRIMRPQQTGTHTVGVSSVMSHAHPGEVRECARLYTARPISLFPTHDGPCGIGTRMASSGLLLPRIFSASQSRSVFQAQKTRSVNSYRDLPLSLIRLSNDRAWATKVPGASPFEMRAAIPMNLACCSTNLSPIPL